MPCRADAHSHSPRSRKAAQLEDVNVRANQFPYIYRGSHRSIDDLNEVNEWLNSRFNGEFDNICKIRSVELALRPFCGISKDCKKQIVATTGKVMFHSKNVIKMKTGGFLSSPAREWIGPF
jgi:hypothetical protein